MHSGELKIAAELTESPALKEKLQISGARCRKADASPIMPARARMTIDFGDLHCAVHGDEPRADVGRTVSVLS